MALPDFDAAIRAVRGGDLDAYSAIVDACQQGVLAAIAFRVPDRFLVEEIAQQTFIFAFEHLGEYAPGTDFGAWLRSIARNRVRSELKNLARENLKSADPWARIRQSVLTEPLARGESEYDPVEVLDRVRGCLGKLPGTWRTLIERHYFARRPVKALAAELQRTVTWVTTSMMRARRAIRACVEAAAGEIR